MVWPNKDTRGTCWCENAAESGGACDPRGDSWLWSESSAGLIKFARQRTLFGFGRRGLSHKYFRPPAFFGVSGFIIHGLICEVR